MWSDETVAHIFDSKERTDDVIVSEAVTFPELLLSENVLSGLKKSGFFKPSPIQLKSIPLGRCGIDLVVQAKSGTGKTCVFSVIALESIIPNSPSLQVLILAPTREIALQIHGVISSIGQDIDGLNVQVFIGGTLVSEDRLKAKRCHIAIASPGRVKQLIELGILVTTNVRLFVLDEADKLVEQESFQPQINWIYSSLPSNKQMIALSATYPDLLAEFLTRYMREPTYVRLNPSQPSLLGLQQYYVVTKQFNMPHLLFEEKTSHVIDLLSSISFQQVLIFSNYHSRAESISEALNSSGWPSTFISGNMEQYQRIEAITKLKDFKCRVLISTDLTSRGIDAHNVDLVINMDVPSDWQTYMHRIGRAGRFGARGIAVSIVSSGSEDAKLQSLAAKCNASISLLSDISTLKDKRTNLLTMMMNDASQKIKESKREDDASFGNGDFSQVSVKAGSKCSNVERPLHHIRKERAPRSNGDCVSEFPSDILRNEGQVESRLNNGSFRKPNLRNGDVCTATTNINESMNSLYQETSKQSYVDSVEQHSVSSTCSNSTTNDVPLISSLLELENRSQHLRKNTHYLGMSYEQLKEDFDFFVNTGTFANPPPNKEDSIISNTFEHFSSKIAQINIGDLPADGDVHNSQAPQAKKKEAEVEKLKSNARMPLIQNNVTKVFHPSINANLPSLHATSESTSKSCQDKSQFKTRKRHPLSVVAGIDQVKYWTNSEGSSTSKRETPVSTKADSLLCRGNIPDLPTHSSEQHKETTCETPRQLNQSKIKSKDAKVGHRKCLETTQNQQNLDLNQSAEKRTVKIIERGFSSRNPSHMEKSHIRDQVLSESTYEEDTSDETSSDEESMSTYSGTSSYEKVSHNKQNGSGYSPHNFGYPMHNPYWGQYPPYHPPFVAMPAPFVYAGPYPNIPYIPPLCYPYSSPATANEAMFAANVRQWAVQHAHRHIFYGFNHE